MIDVNKVKQKILDMVIRGELTKQLKSDGNAADLLVEIQKEKEKQNIEASKTRPYTVGASCASPNADNDLEMPFEIPENWTYTKFMSVCEISTGTSIPKAVKKNKYIGVDKGYCYIGTKDVETNHNIVYENGVKIPYAEKGFEIAPKGSILLCIEGGSAGRKIAIVDRDVCYGNKLCKFYSNHLNKKYIYYYLMSNMFRNIFKNNLTGLIEGVGINTICNLLLPIPPILEQENIVKRIEELLYCVDD